jgi:hypothetical protein
MAVRCSKCGEELLGAVNRCWKCGQAFAQRPEIDGRPPVRADAPAMSQQPLEALVVEQAPRGVSPFAPQTAPRMSQPPFVQPRRATTAEMIDARRASMMAMGGTVASLILGIFAALLALAWPPAAIIAVIGLVMGIWGLYSPRRNLALVGMLLCCLAIGFGTYGMARNVYIYVQSRQPPVIEDTADPVLPEQ